jgi:S-layer protein
MSNATYLEVADQDPSTLANTLYARDFAKSTDLAVATTLVTNLGLSSVAGLDNWVAAQLTAAGSAKGAKIVSLLNDFAGMAADTTYGAAATAFNTKVDAALATSQTAGAAVGVFATAGTVVVSGATFDLTTGIDRGADFIGGAGDDEFVGAGLTALDALNGGAGSDTLALTSSSAITQTASTYTVANIETANVVSGAAVELNTTGWTGLTALNANSLGGLVVTAAASTDVVGSDVGIDTETNGEVTVNGGNNVTLTFVTDDAVTDADSDAEVVVGTTAAAAGAVSVSVTGKYASNTDSTVPDVAVTGGTSVAVTSSAGLTAAQIVAEQTATTANATITQSQVVVTGNESTTSVTVNQDAAVVLVETAAIGRVGIVNGAVTVNDDDAGSSTQAGSIASVTLNNYGNSTISSSALTTVNLSGTGGTVDITTNSLTTAVNTALSLNLNGLSYKNAGTNNAITVDSDVKTLNINSSTATSTVADITASGATAVNVSGDAKVTFTASSGLGAVTAINVTNSKGAAFGSAIAAGVTFTGAEGNDSVTLSDSFRKSITMGAGNDTVTIGGTSIGEGGSVAAGDGVDTVVMTTARAVTLSGTSTFNSKFTGFEVLEVSSVNTTNDVIDLDGINSVDSFKMSAAVTGNLTVNNLSSGGTVTLTTAGASTPVLTVGVASALVGASDVLNLALSSTTARDFGKVVSSNVETVNIKAADAASASVGATDAVIHTLELNTGESATSIVVTGNNGLALTMTSGSSKITNFDASGVVSNATAATTIKAATSDSSTNLAVTYDSLNDTATATVTITGGSGADTLTGGAAMDTISGGAGADTLVGDAGNDTIDGGSSADTITGGDGIDTLTGGTGNDIFVFDTDDSTASAYDTITDLSTTDIIRVSSVTVAMEASITASSTQAGINAYGVASFSHLNADTYASLTQKALLTVEAIGTRYEAAMFTHDGSTFLVIDNEGTQSDAATAATAIVVKLTGVALPTADTVFSASGSASGTGLLGFGS